MLIPQRLKLLTMVVIGITVIIVFRAGYVPHHDLSFAVAMYNFGPQKAAFICSLIGLRLWILLR